MSKFPPPETWDIGLPRYAARCCALELRSHLITRYKKSPTLVRRAFFENGAGDEIRTHDILVGNEMLYH